MAKYGMVINLDKCVGCHACAIACRAEWALQEDRSRCWVKPIGPEETAEGLGFTFYVGLCNHCDDPSCVKECPTGATYKNADGLVLVNKDLCIGCGNCVVACPYGARYTSKIDGKVEKCTFCDGRIQQGLKPACVQTCLTEARTFGDLEDTKSPVHSQVFLQGAVPLATQEVNLHPNVFYLGKEKDLALVHRHFAPVSIGRSLANTLWAGAIQVFDLSLKASFVGVVLAFAHQLFHGEKEGHHHDE